MLRRFRSRLVIVALASAVPTAACSSEAGAPAPPGAEEYLGLRVPEKGEGIQVRTLGVDVPAGEDVQYCEVAELPGEPEDLYYVDGIEFGNAEYSHHLTVEIARDGTDAAANLEEREVGERVPCLTAQSVFGDGFEFLGLAQSPYRSYEYPPGVGREFHGGQRIVFEYHYFNVSDESVPARSAANFRLAEPGDVEHVAQMFQYVNTTIDTPPGASRSFTGECRATRDMQVLELSRHTHRWGKDFEVWYAGGPRDGERVFVSPSYEEGVDHRFAPATALKAGEGFRFRCDFENTATHSLRYGPNATDEMCSLFGLWWSEASNELATEVCVMTQMGSDGIARRADPSAFPEPTAEATAACVDSADGDGPQPAPISDCSRCSCDRCPSLVNRCVADPDCGTLLGCVGRTQCRGTECFTACESDFNDHSPGVGMLIQVAECTNALCTACAG